MRPSCVLLAAAALAVSACSQPAQDGKTADAPAARAETDLKKLGTPRPGLWEQTITGGASPRPVTFRVCVGDGDPDRNPFAPPSEEDEDCQKTAFSRTPTGMNFETVCGSESMTMTSKGVVSGDLRSHYEAVVTTRVSGAELPPGMPTEMNFRVAARRLGDCPAGVEPDTILP